MPVITALLQALWEVERGQESRETRLAPNEKVYLKTGIERHIQVKYENGTKHHFWVSAQVKSRKASWRRRSWCQTSELTEEVYTPGHWEATWYHNFHPFSAFNFQPLFHSRQSLFPFCSMCSGQRNCWGHLRRFYIAQCCGHHLHHGALSAATRCRLEIQGSEGPGEGLSHS